MLSYDAIYILRVAQTKTLNINLLLSNFKETLMAKIIFRKCVQLIRRQENLLSPLFGGLEPSFVTPGLVTARECQCW